MKRTAGVLEVLLSGVFFATIPVFSAFLHRFEVSSFQQAFFRFLISIALLALFFLFFKGLNIAVVKRSDLPVFLAYGFFLAMAYFTYLSSISLGTPVGKAVFLTYTQPLFVMILGRLFLGERITGAKLVASFLSVAGAALILQVWTIGAFSDFFLGDFLAILNGFFYASFIITGRHIRKENSYGHISTTFWSFVLGLACLVPIWAFARVLTPDVSLVGFSLRLPATGWFLLFCLAVFSTLLPYFFLNSGLRRVSASRAGVLLLIEPVVVVLLGVIFFNEFLGFWQMAGGALILLSVVVVGREQK